MITEEYDIDDSRRDLDLPVSLPYTKKEWLLLLHFFVTDEVDCENSGWGNTNQERPAHNPDELQGVVTTVIAQEDAKPYGVPMGWNSNH